MIAIMCVACKKRVTQPAAFSLEETPIENETNPPVVDPTPDPEAPNPEPVPEPEPTPEPTPDPEPAPEPEPKPDPKPTPEPTPIPDPVLKIDKNKGISQLLGKNFQEGKVYYFEDYSGTYRRTVKIEKSGNIVRLVYNDYASDMRNTPRAIYFDEKGKPTDKGNGEFAFPVYQHDNHRGRLNNYGSGNTTVVVKEDGSLQINFTGGYLNALSKVEFKLVK